MARQKKTFQGLTFKDDFLFGTTMMEDPESCAGVIERATGIPVERIEVSREKSMVYHPEYKGIRLDVYAKDENHTHYNIEMQTVRKSELGKRSRYYHSQMDMNLIKTGEDYKSLPDTIVIFICDFDPFGLGKYRYTFRKACKEDVNADLHDGETTIFLNTYGQNEGEVPGELVIFLEYVKADLEGSTKDFEDDFVRHLQETVRRLKASREVEEHYMLLEEMLKDAENRLNKLYRFLMDDNRLEDLKRAIDDEDFREKLYEEYHID